MAHMPDVARRRFFSGTPLDTLKLTFFKESPPFRKCGSKLPPQTWVQIASFQKVWTQIAPTNMGAIPGGCISPMIRQHPPQYFSCVVGLPKIGHL